MIKLIVGLLLPCICFSQIKYNYKNLVLEGGGIWGVAYAGAISVLEQQHILLEIEKIAGTSSGAIAGVMISVGYNATEIDSIMRSLPVEEFNDGKGGIFGKYRRARNNYG